MQCDSVSAVRRGHRLSGGARGSRRNRERCPALRVGPRVASSMRPSKLRGICFVQNTGREQKPNETPSHPGQVWQSRAWCRTCASRSDICSDPPSLAPRRPRCKASRRKLWAALQRRKGQATRERAKLHPSATAKSGVPSFGLKGTFNFYPYAEGSSFRRDCQRTPPSVRQGGQLAPFVPYATASLPSPASNTSRIQEPCPGHKASSFRVVSRPSGIRLPPCLFALRLRNR